MATVRRYSAQGEVPVQQAQLIDPSGFRPDTSSAEALKAGADVVNTFAELAIRKQAAEDSTAANAASESRTLAELEMQQFMITNPDPDTWKEGRAKILAKQAGIYSSQKFSAKAREDDDIRQKAFINKLNIRTEIAETSQKIENNITISGKNLIDLLANDDGTPEDALGIKEQIEDYQDALERKTTPELAELQMEETIKEGKKGFYINQSKLFPEDTIQQMEKKKKALGKGGKDKEGLGAKDYDDIIISATATKNRTKSASKLSASAATKDSYAKIIKGDMDIASMVLAIQNDPTISDEDSNTAVEKVKTFFTTWNSAIEPKVITQDSTRAKALTIAKDVRNEVITFEEGMEIYSKLAKEEKINGTDGKGFMEGIFAADKAATDENKPLKQSGVTRGTTAIEEIIDARITRLDKEDDAKEIDELLLKKINLKNELDKYVLEKSRTSKEIEEEVARLVDGIAEDTVRDILDKILNPLNLKGGTVGSVVRGFLRKRKKTGAEELTDEELETIAGRKR